MTSANQPSPTANPPQADRPALARVGAAVRTRLDADPGAQRIATGQAELWAISGFLSETECARLRAMIDTVARPSSLFTPNPEIPYRTSYSGDVDRADPFVRMIERRIDDLLGIEPEWGEAVQGQRYHPGQEFREHCDWFWTLADYWPGEVRRGGQRAWTAMAYLNAVEEGGTTEFPRIGISVPPQLGALLVWNNATPEGSINWDTTHASRPVVRGVKYVITKWYRTRRWG